MNTLRLRTIQLMSRTTIALLALAVAACGTEGSFGNASFTVGTGWDADNTVPIAIGSVFEASAREASAFGRALRLESDNPAVLAPSSDGVEGRFEAVGAGKASLVARTDAGTELDRMEFEVGVPTAVAAVHWTDLSLDPSARITGDISALANSKVGLKVLVTDSAGQQMRHEGVASLISNSGHPVNVDPSATEPTLSIGASGTGKFSAKVLVKGGAPIVSEHGVTIVQQSDLASIEIAAGPVDTNTNTSSDTTNTSGSSDQMHLIFARCKDPGGKRAYGCQPTWTKISGDGQLLLPTSKASEYNWAVLEAGQKIIVKATLGGLNASKTVENGGQ